MTRWLRGRGVADRLVAATLGVPAGPIVALLVLAVRRHDPGPGLIRLERVGRHGRPFRQWKLRSMRTGGGPGAGPPITGARDPRVTTLGRRLRHLRLDEVPQLLNVIAGQMALLGPRPEAPAYVDLTDRRWQEVLRARPGIAGPTQVLVADWEATVVAAADDPDAYRSVVLPLKLGIDLWYVRNASPWIDLLVIGALARRFVGSPYRTALCARVVAEVSEAAVLAGATAGMTSAGTAERRSWFGGWRRRVVARIRISIGACQ